MAQDAPYFPRAATEDQDLGGINQNFRDLSDRGKDLVGGSDVPGNKCFGTDALCYNDAESRAEVGPNGVCFADGTCQTTAPSASTGALATVTASSATRIEWGSLGSATQPVCYGTVTFTSYGASVLIGAVATGEAASGGITGCMLGVLVDSAYITVNGYTETLTKGISRNEYINQNAQIGFGPFPYTIAPGSHTYCWYPNYVGGQSNGCKSSTNGLNIGYVIEAK